MSIKIYEIIFSSHLLVDKHLGHVHLRFVSDEHIDDMDQDKCNANIVADGDYGDSGHK